MLGCMQSRNMRNSDERDAVWHSNLDFPNFSSKKSTCPLHFCSLPTWFNRPEDAGAGQAPPAPVKKRKSSGTPKEKAAAAGCSWSKSLDVGWVACGRWVHYGWTMPGWSIDVLVHQFHGARLFFENLSFGVSFRNPKMQWNQWEPFENVKMNELTKFPTSFSSGELYSWFAGNGACWSAPALVNLMKTISGFEKKKHVTVVSLWRFQICFMFNPRINHTQPYSTVLWFQAPAAKGDSGGDSPGPDGILYKRVALGRNFDGFQVASTG